MNVVFQYTPTGWTEDRFRQKGGYVAVVLNYNKKGLISAAAKSALEQDGDCYEVVMLDDCSRDGSEQEMLAVARAYAEKGGGNAKVTVAFNETNQTIIGQWKNAVELSSGTWFGMFCGDDVARRNRLSIARQLVGQFPDALGVCTNMSGDGKELMFPCAEKVQWRGTDDYMTRLSIFGCAAWWKRDLLAHPMEKSNLDDFELFWYAMLLRKGNGRVALTWDLSVSTVDYSVGTGVTTDMAVKANATRMRFVKRWREYSVRRTFERRFGAEKWGKILNFATSCQAGEDAIRYIKGQLAVVRMYTGSWWTRLAVFRRRGNFKGVSREIAQCFWLSILGPLGYALWYSALDLTYSLRHRG